MGNNNNKMDCYNCNCERGNCMWEQYTIPAETNFPKGEEKLFTQQQVKLIATRFARQSRLMNDITSNDTITSFDNWFNPDNFNL